MDIKDFLGYYPSITDSNFYQEIYNKKEFHDLILNEDDESKSQIKSKSKKDKDGKKPQIDKVSDNIINNTKPAWTKTPSSLKENHYKDFYRELYPMEFSDPLFHIPDHFSYIVLHPVKNPKCLLWDRCEHDGHRRFAKIFGGRRANTKSNCSDPVRYTSGLLEEIRDIFE